MQKIIFTLEKLDEYHDLWDTMILVILIKKLDSANRQSERWFQGVILSSKIFYKFLKARIIYLKNFSENKQQQRPADNQRRIDKFDVPIRATSYVVFSPHVQLVRITILYCKRFKDSSIDEKRKPYSKRNFVSIVYNLNIA